MAPLLTYVEVARLQACYRRLTGSRRIPGWAADIAVDEAIRDLEVALPPGWIPNLRIEDGE
jgi:hypothetical protein